MTNRTFLFFLVKKTVVSSLAQSLWWIYSLLSLLLLILRGMKKRSKSDTREENHPLTFALSHIMTSYFLALFFRHSLLPNLFFSSSLSLSHLFHNFIGHVLDSVNSVMSLVDYRLYDVMVRVGFRKERWRSSRLYQRTYIKAGLHHIIREGNVYPTKRPGDHESQKGNKGGTDSIAQPRTQTLSNCILYSMLDWELPFWTIKIKLEATSWVGRFMFGLYTIISNKSPITKDASPLEKA